MAASCEYNVEAVADSAQWVVAEIWGWEGLKILTTKKNPASYVVLHRASDFTALVRTVMNIWVLRAQNS